MFPLFLIFHPSFLAFLIAPPFLIVGLLPIPYPSREVSFTFLDDSPFSVASAFPVPRFSNLSLFSPSLILIFSLLFPSSSRYFLLSLIILSPRLLCPVFSSFSSLELPSLFHRSSPTLKPTRPPPVTSVAFCLARFFPPAIVVPSAFMRRRKTGIFIGVPPSVAPPCARFWLCF